MKFCDHEQRSLLAAEVIHRTPSWVPHQALEGLCPPYSIQGCWEEDVEEGGEEALSFPELLSDPRWPQLLHLLRMQKYQSSYGEDHGEKVMEARGSQSGRIMDREGHGW